MPEGLALWFTDGQHRMIYDAIAATTTPDTRTVEAVLRERGQLEEVGGVAYLAGLDVDLPDLAHLPDYAEHLRVLHHRRELARLATKLAIGEGDPLPLVDALDTHAAALRGRSGARGRRVELLPAASIQPEASRHAWAGRIVAADLNVLAGPPGVGKGTAAMWLAAGITRGTVPGDLYGTPRAVVICTAEDHPARVVVPRLLAADADLSLVHLLRVVEGDDEDGLRLPGDVPELARRVAEVDAALVIVDPLSAHLAGDVDSHKDASIRRALSPLARLAHETDAAVLAIAHLNKAVGGDWCRRIGGSVGIGAAARNVLLAGDDPDGDGRLLVHAKSNTAELAPALRYIVEGATVWTDEQAAVPTCRVVWQGEAEGVTAAHLLSEGEGTERGARDDAAAWLSDALASGEPVPHRELERQAQAEGISRTTLHRARKRLGVVVERDVDARGRPSTWRLDLSFHGLSSHGGTKPPGTKSNPSNDGGLRPSEGGFVPHTETGTKPPAGETKRADDEALRKLCREVAEALSTDPEVTL
jgi:hypothetical protein